MRSSGHPGSARRCSVPAPTFDIRGELPRASCEDRPGATERERVQRRPRRRSSSALHSVSAAAHAATEKPVTITVHTITIDGSVGPAGVAQWDPDRYERAVRRNLVYIFRTPVGACPHPAAPPPPPHDRAVPHAGPRQRGLEPPRLGGGEATWRHRVSVLSPHRRRPACNGAARAESAAVHGSGQRHADLVHARRLA